jgi:hypothetical protein
MGQIVSPEVSAAAEQARNARRYELLMECAAYVQPAPSSFRSVLFPEPARLSPDATSAPTENYSS